MTSSPAPKWGSLPSPNPYPYRQRQRFRTPSCSSCMCPCRYRQQCRLHIHLPRRFGSERRERRPSHAQAAQASALRSLREVVPVLPALSAPHRAWRRCHGPPPHSRTLRVSKTPAITNRTFVSGYHALDFPNAEQRGTTPSESRRPLASLALSPTG